MTKPLRADAQRNRDALVAKAREVFAAGEFDLRFDDFARRAGVGVGTLYRHFPTREALVEAVYRDEIEAICGRARELAATLPPNEALAAFLRGLVAYLGAHLGLAHSLATGLATREGAMLEGGRALREAVTLLMAAADVREDVGPEAVMMALNGICASYDQPHWEPQAQGVVTLILDGLRRS